MAEKLYQIKLADAYSFGTEKAADLVVTESTDTVDILWGKFHLVPGESIDISINDRGENQIDWDVVVDDLEKRIIDVSGRLDTALDRLETIIELVVDVERATDRVYDRVDDLERSL